MRRRTYWGDDLAVLPSEDREWSRRGLWRRESTEEEMAIWLALRVISQHAFEARDQRMAGRVLAAVALEGGNVAWVWEDCTKLLPLPVLSDPTGDSYEDAARGELLRAEARAFFVSGVRRRPSALLRAEARGLLFAIRWLFRAGLLPSRALIHAETEPWRRVTGAPAEAHPHILGPLPPAAANLN